MKGLVRRVAIELCPSRCKSASRSQAAVKAEVEWVFRELGKNGDDKIDFTEVQDLVVELCNRLANLEQGVRSLERVVKSLDRILSAMVLITTGIVYDEHHFRM
jgi:hypothetical protein